MSTHAPPLPLGAARPPWAVIRVRGPEAVAYLQGQLSQDVAGLAPGSSTWTLLLAPTGKLDAWLRVTRLADDAVLLDAPAPHPDPIVARLARFKLRTDAEIEALPWAVVALRGPGAAAAAHAASGADDLVLPAGWPGIEGADLLGPSVEIPDAIPDVGIEGFDARRLAAGVPALGAELSTDTIPAEAGAWVIESSVDFTKGCFTGQELVARIDSRGGNVPRPIRVLRVEGETVPAVGAEVRSETGSAVGRITSVARSEAHGILAMGPLTRAVEPPAAVTLSWDGHEVGATVVPAPLAPPA